VSALALARTFASRSSAGTLKRLEAVEARAALWQATGAELVERAEDVFQRIERKRASAAASASRAEAARAPEDEAPPAPRSRAEVRALRRGGAL
jgi:hypothetical protein